MSSTAPPAAATNSTGGGGGGERPSTTTPAAPPQPKSRYPHQQQQSGHKRKGSESHRPRSVVVKARLEARPSTVAPPPSLLQSQQLLRAYLSTALATPPPSTTTTTTTAAAAATSSSSTTAVSTGGGGGGGSGGGSSGTGANASVVATVTGYMVSAVAAELLYSTSTSTTTTSGGRGGGSGGGGGDGDTVMTDCESGNAPNSGGTNSNATLENFCNLLESQLAAAPSTTAASEWLLAFLARLTVTVAGLDTTSSGSDACGSGDGDGGGSAALAQLRSALHNCFGGTVARFVTAPNSSNNGGSNNNSSGRSAIATAHRLLALCSAFTSLSSTLPCTPLTAADNAHLATATTTTTTTTTVPPSTPTPNHGSGSGSNSGGRRNGSGGRNLSVKLPGSSAAESPLSSVSGLPRTPLPKTPRTARSSLLMPTVLFGGGLNSASATPTAGSTSGTAGSSTGSGPVGSGNSFGSPRPADFSSTASLLLLSLILGSDNNTAEFVGPLFSLAVCLPCPNLLAALVDLEVLERESTAQQQRGLSAADAADVAVAYICSEHFSPLCGGRAKGEDSGSVSYVVDVASHSPAFARLMLRRVIPAATAACTALSGGGSGGVDGSGELAGLLLQRQQSAGAATIGPSTAGSSFVAQLRPSDLADGLVAVVTAWLASPLSTLLDPLSTSATVDLLVALVRLACCLALAGSGATGGGGSSSGSQSSGTGGDAMKRRASVAVIHAALLEVVVTQPHVAVAFASPCLNVLNECATPLASASSGSSADGGGGGGGSVHSLSFEWAANVAELVLATVSVASSASSSDPAASQGVARARETASAVLLTLPAHIPSVSAARELLSAL